MNGASCRITLDISALSANYNFLRQKTSPSAQVAAVVKADGYGLDVEKIVPVLEKSGAGFFYVAQLSEALTVRAHTKKPIAVLGGLPADCVDMYRQNRIIPVLNTLGEIALCPPDLPSIWHIDTGMNRLGLDVEEVGAAVASAKSLPILMITHFASSDEAETLFNTEQVRRFDACIATLPRPFQLIPQSICNSSGIFRNADWHRAQVRAGVALYGANPTPEGINPMRPVVGMAAKILQIRTAKKGETAGYNRTHVFPKDTALAVVGMGYADGFLRSASNRAKLYWNGAPCPIVGRVSMDLIIVDIGNVTAASPHEGDWLEVLGPAQSLESLAQDCGTIPYEILTQLSRRAAVVHKA